MASPIDVLATDAASNLQAAEVVASRPVGFNGTAWDRLRTVGVGDTYSGVGVPVSSPMVYDGSNFHRARAASSDAIGASGTGVAGAFAAGFNGTTWDRLRNNQEVVAANLAAQTVSVNSGDLTNFNGRGVNVVLDVTAASGTTPTLDVKLQAKDSLSGKYVDIPGASFTQSTTTGTKMLQVYPGVTVAANVGVSAAMPRVWRVAITIGGTTPSFSFTVGASVIL